MHPLRIVDALELATAYAAADYAVRLDGDALPLRVGEPAHDIEAYWPALRYAFITAWNPASQPHSDDANARADALLVAMLDERRLARQPAWASDRDGGWREPGWLVADVDGRALDDATLDRLALEFGQAGVLAWTRGAPVRLRMLLRRPEANAAGGPDWTDWVGGPAG